jgi:hypothetical protein
MGSSLIVGNAQTITNSLQTVGLEIAHVFSGLVSQYYPGSTFIENVIVAHQKACLVTIWADEHPDGKLNYYEALIALRVTPPTARLLYQARTTRVVRSQYAPEKGLITLKFDTTKNLQEMLRFLHDIINLCDDSIEEKFAPKTLKADVYPHKADLIYDVEESALAIAHKQILSEVTTVMPVWFEDSLRN